MTRRRLLAAFAALALVGATGAWLALRQQVKRALESPRGDARALQLVALERPRRPPEVWPGPEVEAVAFPGGDLVAAGAAGVWHARRGDITPGLPSRRALALALWTGDAVVALEAGGVFVERGAAWHELRSGWGLLHARALLQTAAGELLIGAREGLFRVAAGAAAVERLDTHPVRALALVPGAIVAGGEQGLVRVEPLRVTKVATPDPWIESLAVAGDTLFAVSAAGLARGPHDGPLDVVRGGEAVAQAAWHEGRLWTASDPAQDALRVVQPDGTTREEALPGRARRVLSAAGLLLADTDVGLYRRDPDGWHLALPRGPALPPGPAHVTALARFRGRLFAGLFDGGLVAADERADHGLAWRRVPGTAAWGVNALLVAGGELWVASLRGAARLDAGEATHAVAGAGAAFSLAQTRDGVAVGYGQGVLLPGGALVSAFHGLPGNQALALAEQGSLFVGTPSGLGALAGRRVLWRVTGGEGKLPHPWVTALLPQEDGLLVGTWGGGLVRRRETGRAAGSWRDGARFEPFSGTERLEVSPGALAASDGRAWAGTDADGLWRESKDRARFERVAAALPSARVTALLAESDVLWVGTDQGIVRLPVGAAD